MCFYVGPGEGAVKREGNGGGFVGNGGEEGK